MEQTPEQFRILAIALSSRGFGYTVMEPRFQLVDYGKKVASGDKNAWLLKHIQRLILVTRPHALLLHSIQTDGIQRAPRIKQLHRSVVTLAKHHKVKVVELSRTEVRTALLGNSDGTKHEMATTLAQRFPDELASRLPPKRTAWVSEDSRMDMFCAVALAVVFQDGHLTRDRENKETVIT